LSGFAAPLRAASFFLIGRQRSAPGTKGRTMAFEEYDDYEQSERVQQWLRQNGVSILVGIVLGLLLIFGWQQWKAHKARHHAEASEQYASLQKAYQAGNQSDAKAIADTLRKDYADSAYAVFAAALEAKHQIESGHADKARSELEWAAAHAEEASLKGLMQLRLARVDLADGKAADALKALDAVPAGDYVGLLEELRGDALVKLGRTSDARKAYEAALAALGENAPQRGSVQMKIDNLATAGKQGA
jgi:predicted negative regulator of RcsB-dependent stress response